MASRYDTYGFKKISINEAIQQIENILSIKFIKHDSEYRGIYYLAGKSQVKGFMIYTNRIYDYSINPEYSDYSTILTVSNLDNMDDIQKALTTDVKQEAVLLKSTVYQDHPLN